MAGKSIKSKAGGSRPGAAGPEVGMVDLILGYACNSACVFCTAEAALRATAMTTGEALRKLDGAVSLHKPAKVRFGGGEPTVRKDLPALVRFAGSSGVPLVVVQTNGYMLAYRDYVGRLADSGLGRVNVSVRAHSERLYTELTGVPHARRLALSAVANAVDAKVAVELDVLMVRPVLKELGALTDHYLALGAAGINYWFVSAEGRAMRAPDLLVPTMSEAALVLKGIFNRHPSAALKSFYIPYCFFPEHQDRVWHPISEKTLVVTPGDEFMLERGRIDVGVKTDRCGGCRHFATCFGVRRNYLDLRGDSEIEAVR